MQKKFAIMIRPNSTGASWASVPGFYDIKIQAEDAQEEIHRQDSTVQVLIIPVFV